MKWSCFEAVVKLRDQEEWQQNLLWGVVELSRSNWLTLDQQFTLQPCGAHYQNSTFPALLLFAGNMTHSAL